MFAIAATCFGVMNRKNPCRAGMGFRVQTAIRSPGLAWLPGA